MKELDIEYQYQLYLSKVGLDELKMSYIQRLETKRAFYGACGQMLLLFRDNIGTIEDEYTAVTQMEKLFSQVQKFWKEQI
ncbi:hypothetical protein VS868_11885 [Salinimicrobium sp. 3283s]|uniref:hypothetical protein n=1 Tax=Salinimicrobium sp. 3283s TaxID=3114359 RepID=UPI0031EF059A